METFLVISQFIGTIIGAIFIIVILAIFIVATYNIYKHEFCLEWDKMEERITKLEKKK